MDFNGDGHDDILSGSYPGELYFFRGIGDGEFAKGEMILNKEGEPIKPGSASVAFAADWDHDGDFDLLSGSLFGGVYLLINEGSKDQAQFSGKFKKLAAGGYEIKDAGHTGPVIADLDGDGLDDLIVGGDKGVHFYRNIGKRTAPEYAKGVLVIENNSRNQLVPADGRGLLPGVRIKPHVVDYNGDGKLDLLLGDSGSQTIQRGGLTTEEQAELKALKAHKAELDAEYEGIFALRDRLLNETFTPEEKTAYWAVARPLLSGKVIERTPDDSRAVKAGHDYVASLNELRPRQDAVGKALEKYKTDERSSIGAVWLYLQK